MECGEILQYRDYKYNDISHKGIFGNEGGEQTAEIQ